MLTFEPTAHRYAWHGRTVPSVTQALEPLFDFSKVPYSMLERKRRIGVAVHEAIEFTLAGLPVELDDDAQPYFDAWKRFVSECSFEPMLTEFRVHNDELGEQYHYAGTIDQLGLLQGRLSLIDWKCCLQLNDAAVGAQLAAYLRALHRMELAPLFTRRYALKLGADGRYKLERYRALDTDWQTFVYRLREHVNMQEVPS